MYRQSPIYDVLLLKANSAKNCKHDPDFSTNVY